MSAAIMGLSVFGRGPRAHRLVDKTGRNMAFWIGHMEAWAEKQRRIVARRARGALPLPRRNLVDVGQVGALTHPEDLALTALALQHADLLMGGEIDYRSALSTLPTTAWR